MTFRKAYSRMKRGYCMYRASRPNEYFAIVTIPDERPMFIMGTTPIGFHIPKEQDIFFGVLFPDDLEADDWEIASDGLEDFMERIEE